MLHATKKFYSKCSYWKTFTGNRHNLLLDVQVDSTPWISEHLVYVKNTVLCTIKITTGYSIVLRSLDKYEVNCNAVLSYSVIRTQKHSITVWCYESKWEGHLAW